MNTFGHTVLILQTCDHTNVTCQSRLLAYSPSDIPMQATLQHDSTSITFPPSCKNCNRSSNRHRRNSDNTPCYHDESYGFHRNSWGHAGSLKLPKDPEDPRGSSGGLPQNPGEPEGIPGDPGESRRIQKTPKKTEGMLKNPKRTLKALRHPEGR